MSNSIKAYVRELYWKSNEICRGRGYTDDFCPFINFNLGQSQVRRAVYVPWHAAQTRGNTGGKDRKERVFFSFLFSSNKDSFDSVLNTHIHIQIYF